MEAALVATCLRGALPPAVRRGVCFDLAIVVLVNAFDVIGRNIWQSDFSVKSGMVHIKDLRAPYSLDPKKNQLNVKVYT